MFGRFRKNLLLEHKKMLWQNFFGAKEISERIVDRKKMFGLMDGESEAIDAILGELGSIYNFSAAIINTWDYKSPLDAQTASKMWGDNKKLRNIYDDQFPSSRTAIGVSFDDFINPPYGWDVALRDWN
jgi:hypothetical protein